MSIQFNETKKSILFLLSQSIHEHSVKYVGIDMIETF